MFSTSRTLPTRFRGPLSAFIGFACLKSGFADQIIGKGLPLPSNPQKRRFGGLRQWKNSTRTRTRTRMGTKARRRYARFPSPPLTKVLVIPRNQKERFLPIVCRAFLTDGCAPCHPHLSSDTHNPLYWIAERMSVNRSLSSRPRGASTSQLRLKGVLMRQTSRTCWYEASHLSYINIFMAYRT